MDLAPVIYGQSNPVADGQDKQLLRLASGLYLIG